MSYNPDIHHRQSIRLKHYDYSQPGTYFVTICTQNRICFFGDIIDSQMHLNPAGLVVDKLWRELPRQFTSISIDDFVLMPNHLHGLINIESESGKSLHQMLQYFKAISTSEYSFGVKQLNWEPYPGKLWQRNYYEHIVRNENSLNEIRRYIQYNPQEWGTDKENPHNIDHAANFM